MTFKINSMTVLVIGHTGVGKTSLLTCVSRAMKDLTPPGPNFWSALNPSGPYFWPDSRYDERERGLRGYIKSVKSGESAEHQPATQGERTYTHRVIFQSGPVVPIGLKDLEIEIRFKDMPGEWLADPDKSQIWLALIKESDIVKEIRIETLC